MAYYPQPIANGNLLFMRTTSKMLRAFERSPTWQQARCWAYICCGVVF